MHIDRNKHISLANFSQLKEEIKNLELRLDDKDCFIYNQEEEINKLKDENLNFKSELLIIKTCI